MDLWLKCLLGFIAAAIVVGGILIGIFFSGSLLVALGSGMFAAGFNGFLAVFGSEVTLKSFFITMAKGFAIGFISGLFSIAAASLIQKISTTCHRIIPYLAAAGIGSITGLLINGISNVLNGKNFSDGWLLSMILGAITGVACYHLANFKWSDESIEVLQKLRDKLTTNSPKIKTALEWILKIVKMMPVVQQSQERLRSTWNLANDLLARRNSNTTPRPHFREVNNRRSGNPPGNSEDGDNGDDDGDSNSGNSSDDDEKPGISEITDAIGQLTEEELEELTSQLEQQSSTFEEQQNSESFTSQPGATTQVEDSIASEQQNMEDELNVDEEQNTVDDPRLVENRLQDAQPLLHDEISTQQESCQPSVLENLTNATEEHHQNMCDDVITEGTPIPEDTSEARQNTFADASFVWTNLNSADKTIRQSFLLKDHKHLSNADMKIKSRAVPLNGSNLLVNGETNLFDCFKRQNELAREQQTGQSEKVKNLETVEARLGGQRVGVRVSDASSSSSSTRLAPTNDHITTNSTKTPSEVETPRPSNSESSVKRKIILPDDVTRAVVFKIACHCEKKNEYVISTTWPEFDYDVRVVGVQGIKQSGVTYSVQRTIMGMGYSMTELDIALSRLPIGITGYLLQKDRILIVECCDGLNFDLGDGGNDVFNMGGAFMELLTFCMSSRVLYSYPFNSSSDLAAKHMISHFDLLVNMSCLYGLPTKKDIRVMLRTGKDSSKDVDGMADQLRKHLTKKAETMQSDDTPEAQSNQNGSKKSDNREKDKNEDSVMSDDLKQRLEFILATCTLDARILKYHELSDVPISYGEANTREMQELIQFVRDETSSIKMDSWSVRHTAKNLFKSMKKKGLAKKLTEFQNSNVQEQNKSDLSEAVEKYLKEVSNFHKRALNSSGVYRTLGGKLSNYFKEFEAKVKKVKESPEEERTGIMYHIFIQHVIDIGNMMLTFSTDNQSESTLCKDGILLGLHGYLVFPSIDLDNTLMNQVALRMTLEAGLMDHLKKPIVNKHFKECWKLLTLLARFGFRLALMEFDFWSTAQDFFKADTENPDLPRDKLIIYSAILELLKEMSSESASAFLPKEMNFWEERENGISHQSIAQIGFDFESEISMEIDEMCKKVIDNNSNCSEEHKKFVDQPNTWIQKSIYEEQFKNATKDQQEHLLQMLIHRNFELLHKSFAFHMSKKIMTILPEIVSFAYENQSLGKDIMKHRLAIAANLADAFTSDPILVTKLLKENSVLSWLIELVKRNEIPTYFPNILRTCISLILCEKGTQGLTFETFVPQLRNVAHAQFVTNDDFRERSGLLCMLSDITYTRHELLNAGIVQILIDHFLRRAAIIYFNDYIIALFIFLIRGHGLHFISADLLISSRQEISAKVLGHMRDLTQRLKGNDVDDAVKVSITSKIANCAQLLNQIMTEFQTGGYQGNFFPLNSATNDCQLGIENRKELVTVLGEIYSLQQFRNNDYPEMAEQILQLMLNMASLSGMSVTKALRVRGESLNGHQETIPTKKTFYGNVDQLDIDTKYEKDDAFLTVAAHIVAGQKHMFTETRSILRQKVTHVKNYLRDEKTQEEDRKKWSEDQRVRRERKAVQMASIDSEAMSQRYRSMEQPTVKRVLAIKDVFVISGRLRISKINSIDPGQVFFRLSQLYSEEETGKRLAHFLQFYNNPAQKSLEFVAVTELMEKMSKTQKIFKLNRENDKVKPMLKLVHFDMFLLKFGYKETAGWFKANDEDAPAILKNIEHFLKTSKNFDGSLTPTLDSKFCRITNAADPNMILLPKAFFSSKTIDENLLSCMSSASVAELLQMRRKSQRWPRQLEYTLVRVWKGEECFQAVFHPEATISHVQNSLQNSQISATEFRVKSTKKVVGNRDPLSNVGYYFIELTVTA